MRVSPENFLKVTVMAVVGILLVKSLGTRFGIVIPGL